MTSEEVRRVLAYLRAAFPAFDLRADDAAAMVEVWSDALRNADGETVFAAVRSVIATHRQFPSIAVIHEAIATMSYGALPSEVDAWAVCTSQTVPAVLHPVLRECLRVTGGVQSLSWCSEAEMMRRIRSAYWRAVEGFRADEAAGRAELPQSDGPRALGEPRPLGGTDA